MIEGVFLARGGTMAKERSKSTAMERLILLEKEL